MKQTSLSSLWIRFALAAILALGAASLFGAAPVLDEPVPAGGETPKVTPTVPVGKALVLPITASDSDGDPLAFTVTSSHPKIFARIKSGNPHLKLSVSFEGSGGVSAFSGEMEFQLFRDWAPITAAHIGGFAQSGFYDNLKFHRVVEDFVIQGGDPNGTGSGGPGFQFDNEFRAPLIFTGRGQLAMANSGFSQTYRGTNGSQFFVTLGSPRSLDFTHTIFGQLVRGFDVLDKIEAVPKTAASGSTEISKPTVDVKIVSAAVVPNNHDAVLVVSAAGLGTSLIVVTVDDGKGGISSKTLAVTAQPDTSNSPPFLEPLRNAVVQKDSRLVVPFELVDLEYDYFFLRQFLLSGELAALTEGNPAKIKTNSTFEGSAGLLAGVAQFNMNGPAAQFDDFVTMSIGVADGAIDPRHVLIEAAPAETLSNVVVARFQDSDLLGAPENSTAQINWGDGTPLVSGTSIQDTALPGLAITGSHTYARAGIYPVVVEIAGNKGARTTVRSTALVSAGPLRAAGRTLDVRGSHVRDAIVATFSDAMAPSGERSDLYEASIDWGDGGISPGTIAGQPDGSFAVSGSHTYADVETYSIRVDVKKTESAATATGWSTANVSRFASPRRLPPFPQTHLIADYNTEPQRVEQGSAARLQTSFEGDMIIVNSGSKVSPANTKLRFWLSDDEAVSANDLPVKIGPLKEVSVQRVRPGATIRYVFEKDAGGDFRLKLPKGETGLKRFLLAQLKYSDPIADYEKIDKVLVNGPITGVEVHAVSNSLVTTEEGGQTKFNVVLNHLPSGDVTIPLESSDPGEGTVSPGSLTFTPANAFTPQLVTVTGMPDGQVDGDQEFMVQLKAITSVDPLYNGTDAGDVAITNSDSLLQVSPSSGLTTTEAGGSATFFVRLARNPSAAVSLSVASTDPGEGTVSPATLTFTPANATSFQAVTVNGVDDTEDDGNVGYTIQVRVTSSGDSAFIGRGADVSATNTDNDPTP